MISTFSVTDVVCRPTETFNKALASLSTTANLQWEGESLGKDEGKGSRKDLRDELERELLVSSVLFFSRPRFEGWPHHGRTFSIYVCPLSYD